MTKDEAITIIQDYIDLDSDTHNEFLDALRVLVNPWIPCEERLPKPYDDVIISAKNYVCEAHLRESEEYFLTHNARMFIKTEETDAWMPLPKAYEGRTE